MNNSKIVLVTGGSRGLGKNMALRLADKGLNVIVTYHSKKNEAENVVSEIKEKGQNAIALQLDTSKTETFESFFNEVKHSIKSIFATDKIDYLVNNAGVGISASFSDTKEDQFDILMNTHFKGPYFLTQRALAFMNDGGGIINITTGLTRITHPTYPAYSSMKAAMENLTRYQANELGSRQIKVNIVAPGAIETDFGGGSVRDNKETNQHLASATALGRVGLPDDIGGVVAFLCTDDARWINAQRIEVSGGQML